MQNEGRSSGLGGERTAHETQSLLNNPNWNGLSPRNRHNQNYYQNSRGSQELAENGELSEYEMESPVKRKRLASPSSVHERHAKRAAGQRESFDDERRTELSSPFAGAVQRYSPVDYESLPPNPRGSRRSLWVEPEMPTDEQWEGRTARRSRHMSLRQTPRYTRETQLVFRGARGSNQHGEQKIYTDDSQLEKSCQIAMEMARKHPKNYTFPQQHMSSWLESQNNSLEHEVVDLTSPESLPTRSEDTSLRTVPATEPTDLEYGYESSVQRYKNSQRQPRTLMNQFAHGTYHNPQSEIRNPFSSQFDQKMYKKDQGHGRSIHSRKQSEPVGTPPFGRRNDNSRHSQFMPAIKMENLDRPNSLREIFTYSSSIDGSHQVASHDDLQFDDPESNGDETVEETMRKRMLQKKAEAAKNASRDILSKRIDFGGSRRSGSEYSRQVVGKSKPQEELQRDTLSRIRVPGPPKFGTHSSALDFGKGPGIEDSNQYIVIQQTAAQKAAASQKEKREIKRQKLAIDAMILKEQQAKDLQGTGFLFEESPIEKAKEERIKLAKVADKKRKFIIEKAKIVGEHDKELAEKLVAAQKRHFAEELEEFNAEKRMRVEAKRKQEKEIEEERLNAKRMTAARIMKLNRIKEEEARLENLDKLNAEKHAAKARAGALQASKKVTSKPTPTEYTIAMKETTATEVAIGNENDSDDCMFVAVDHITESNDVIPQEQLIATTEVSATNGQTPANASENISTHEDLAGTKKTVPHSSGETPVLQKPDIVTRSGDCLTHMSVPVHETPHATTIVPMNASDASVIAANTPRDILQVMDSIEIAATTPLYVPNVTESDVQEGQATPSIVTSGAKISEIASDGRRRQPEVSKPKTVRQASPDPISCTSSPRTSQLNRNLNQNISYPSNPVSKTRNTENEESWDTTMSDASGKISTALTNLRNELEADNIQLHKRADRPVSPITKNLTLEDARNNKRASFERARYMKPDLLAGSQPVVIAKKPKNLSLTSSIELRSQVESQIQEKQKAEQERITKYKKRKARCKRRYEREIRQVFSKNGMEADENKISKQLEEKMVVWETNSRKRELKEFGSVDHLTSMDLQNAVAIDAGQSQQTQSVLEHTSDDLVIDPQLLEEQQNTRVVREGMRYLASQNDTGNSFAKAASKSRIEDIESDESEEDSDDDSDAHGIPNNNQAADETLEDLFDLEFEKTLLPETLNESIIPALPQLPILHESTTAFLPDIVNPKEEDLMYSYSVRHRAGRGNNVYDSVIIGNFHSLEEANAFASQKVSEFEIGPGTGKTEIYDIDNNYIGRVITNIDENHEETVWVTKETIYIGDTTNVTLGNIKKVITPKVFNVIQMLEGEDGSHTGTVIATSSIMILANRKAAAQAIVLCKPSRPRIDAMKDYNELVSAIHAQLAKCDAANETISIEGEIPGTERKYSINISENEVVGPIN